MGEKYSLQMKLNNLSNVSKSPDIAINEVMQAITSTTGNHTDRTEPIHEAADKEDLLSLFDQYSDLVSPTSDRLSADIAVVINGASLEAISTTYHITTQQCTTTALFDTSTNMLVISQKIFNSLPQKAKNC